MAAPNNCFRVSETTCKAGQASVGPFNVVDRTSFCMLVIVMITCFCSCYQNIACAQTATQRATHFHDHREAIVAGTVTSCSPQAFQPGTLAPSLNVLSSYLPFNPSASCLCSATTCKSTLMAIASMCELVVCVGRDQCGPWTRSSAARALELLCGPIFVCCHSQMLCAPQDRGCLCRLPRTQVLGSSAASRDCALPPASSRFV